MCMNVHISLELTITLTVVMMYCRDRLLWNKYGFMFNETT